MHPVVVNLVFAFLAVGLFTHWIQDPSTQQYDPP